MLAFPRLRYGFCWAASATSSSSTGPQATVPKGAARELFATVILARFTADTWQVLAPTAGPAPKQRHPQQGRYHVIQHGEVEETHAIRMTDADVVAWLTDPDDPSA